MTIVHVVVVASESPGRSQLARFLMKTIIVMIGDMQAFGTLIKICVCFLFVSEFSSLAAYRIIPTENGFNVSANVRSSYSFVQSFFRCFVCVCVFGVLLLSREKCWNGRRAWRTCERTNAGWLFHEWWWTIIREKLHKMADETTSADSEWAKKKKQILFILALVAHNRVHLHSILRHEYAAMGAGVCEMRVACV